MKTGGGDFSAEAYQQLREAYDKEQQRQVDDELAGTKLMGQEYGLETLPVDSPWKDKIENWQYPSGRGQYLDEHQSPEEVLKVMREAAQERLDAKAEESEEDELENMSDEEFDAHIDKILADAEVDDSEEEEEVSEADEEDEDEVEEEESEEDEDEDDSEEESDDVEESDEEDEAEAKDESEEEVDDDSEQDAEDIAAEIAALRAEIEGMQFVSETTEEEPEADDESDLQEDEK